MRVWDVFDTRQVVETLVHVRESACACALRSPTWCAVQSSDVLAVAYRPDGKEICTASLDGQLCLWDPVNGCGARTARPPAARERCVHAHSVLKGTIEGKNDLLVRTIARSARAERAR